MAWFKRSSKKQPHESTDKMATKKARKPVVVPAQRRAKTGPAYRPAHQAATGTTAQVVAESSAPKSTKKTKRAKLSAKTQKTSLPQTTSAAVATTPTSTSAKKQARLQALRQLLQQNRTEVIVLGVLVLISIIAHAFNMLHYPYLENDEATYTSRAWAFVTTGELDVYTYRYDHAPLGWMLIGLWQFISGGTHIFSSLLTSGRVFMLLVHVASTIVLYVLARRFSGGNKLAPVIAVLIFALSPLAIYFQRRILLDNIMTLWLLVSMLIISSPGRRLKQYIWSGVIFGIAVLTKLNAIFLGPAFLYIIWRRARHEHRLHALGYWLAMAGMVVAGFFLFALLKGELFASPLGPDGTPLHVSLVDTFSLQLGRGDFAWPWDPHSSFRSNVESWALKDWFTLAVGMAATLIIGIVGFFKQRRQPYLLFVSLLALCYIAFLARGKIVLDLYVVPLLPLLALAIGLFVQLIADRVRTKSLQIAFAVGVVAIFAIGYGGMVVNKQYTVDETTNQQKAIAWIEQNVPKNAIIATDNYAYPALAQEHGYNKVTYFFSTEYDPEVRKTYHNDWRNVEYLLVTHEIVEQIKTGTVPRMKAIFDHAELVADYRNNSSSFIDLKHYISTNGDWAQVYKVKNRNAIVQQDTWDTFKGRYVVDYGQVIDDTNNNLTTSAGQATGMLRALDAGDKDMFNGMWQWSKDHLKHRQTDVLLSWQWLKQPDDTYTLGDSNTVCDADQTIAYALLKAGAAWQNEDYTKEGRAHLADWWAQCVFERNGGLFVDSSADGSQDIRLINTGYFNPAYYRYFATAMPSLPWQRLIDDGYGLLDTIYARWLTMPNWVTMETNGSLASAEPLVGAGADSFGYDALQLVPHLAADTTAAPAGDTKATAMLQKIAPAVQHLATTDHNPTTNIAYLLTTQAANIGTSKDRQATYEKVIFKPYNSTKALWRDGKNYRNQVWFWQWYHAQVSLPANQQVSLK